MEYDFRNLTDNQKFLIVMQGWSLTSNFPQPPKHIVKKLIDRNLVIEHKVKSQGMVVTEYEVTIPVHMAFCAQCKDEII